MTKSSPNPISFDDFSEGLLNGQNLAEQCGLSKTALDTCYTGVGRILFEWVL